VFVWLWLCLWVCVWGGGEGRSPVVHVDTFVQDTSGIARRKAISQRTLLHYHC
jgi:hypothetical protein